MVADQIRLCAAEALETGLRDQTVDPNNPAQLRALEAQAVRGNELAASDDRIGQPLFAHRLRRQHRRQPSPRILLSTNPDNEDKPLPARPNYKRAAQRQSHPAADRSLRPAQGLRHRRSAGPQRPAFATVHVGVRTTLLRAVYAPWLTRGAHADGLCAGHGSAGRPSCSAIWRSARWNRSACSSTTGPRPAATAAKRPSRRHQTGHGRARLHQDRADRPAHAQRGRGLLRVEGESRPDSRQPAGRNPALHRRWPRGAGF